MQQAQQEAERLQAIEDAQTKRKSDTRSSRKQHVRRCVAVKNGQPSQEEETIQRDIQRVRAGSKWRIQEYKRKVCAKEKHLT